MNYKAEFTRYILSNITNNKKQIKKQWNSGNKRFANFFYIDDLLPKKYLKLIYKSFPINDDHFFQRKSLREKKRTSANLSKFDPILTDITYALQDVQVVSLISKILSLKNLEPDPLLYAGGISRMMKGDFLNPHIDNSHDLKNEKYRRLNLLFYISPNWKVKNGGNLELWSPDFKKNKTILSKENRLVVMETNQTSWHSVSPVKVDFPRCCISNYYFSNNPPYGNNYFHVTSFSGRPNQYFRKFYGFFDNYLRNFVGKNLKISRGRKLINKEKS